MRRVEGERLDVVLQRLRETDTPGALLDLKGVEPSFDREQPASGRTMDKSAEALLVDFIIPLISDPTIFHDYNAISLLEQLRDEVLPHLGDDPELTELATRVIDNELAHHQFVRQCRTTGIAS